jgi:hypothetical protein
VRRRALILIVGSLLAVLAYGVGVPSAATRSCGTVGAPGFHAFEVEAKGVSCRTARRLLKSWLEKGAKPSGGPQGWRCRRSFSRPWRCKRRTAVISFIYHSY